MGNGRSGITKSSAGFEAYKNIHKQAKDLGYNLKKSKALGDALNNKDSLMRSSYRDIIVSQFSSLMQFRNAMDNPTDVEGTITFKASSGSESAKTNPLNEVTVNTNLLHISDRDELVHEDTHNLVHSLITKELGFKKGSAEYIKAYLDGAIERDINIAAYKKYYIEVLRKPWSEKKDPGEQQIRAAVDMSGMRDYALHQYPFIPKGTFIEVPTVAAECFHKVGYSWTKLHKEYPYAYHVMREIYDRLHR